MYSYEIIPEKVREVDGRKGIICNICTFHAHGDWFCTFINEDGGPGCFNRAIVGSCITGFGVCISHLHLSMSRVLELKKDGCLFIPLEYGFTKRKKIIHLLNTLTVP